MMSQTKRKGLMFEIDRDGKWFLIDLKGIAYSVNDNDGRIVCPDSTFLGGQNGLCLRLDVQSGQKYLVDGKKIYNVNEKREVVDAFGNIVKDITIFSFNWPKWESNEDLSAKKNIGILG